MKNKKLLMAALTLFLMAILTLSASAQTEKEILENMIKAMGGREALAAVKDTRGTGTIEIIQFGMTAPFTYYQKEPNKYRMEFEVMGMSVVQTYDGEKGMWINPQTGEISELPPDQARQIAKQSWGNDIFLNPDKHGVTHTYKGKEEVNGKSCHVLEQKFPDGDRIIYYLDSSNYLIYKTRTTATSPTGGELEVEMVFSDYRKINRVVTAFSWTMFQGGAEYARFTLNEVVYNTGLDDSLFVLK